MELNKIEIGKRIQELRKQKGLSLITFGEMVDLNPSTLSRYEQGKLGSISVDTIKKFAKALNTSYEYLLGIDKLGKINAQKRWMEEVGTEEFSKEELDEIIKYAKYIISQRKD